VRDYKSLPDGRVQDRPGSGALSVFRKEIWGREGISRVWSSTTRADRSSRDASCSVFSDTRTRTRQPMEPFIHQPDGFGEQRVEFARSCRTARLLIVRHWICVARDRRMTEHGHARSSGGFRMAVTWFVFPERPRAELLLIDPYTFTEFEDAMLGILDTPAPPRDLRILIDRRRAARPTSSFVGCMVDFFRAHEAQLAGTRAAVLVSDTVLEALPDLRVGRFRIRTFHDATEAAEWLHPDADRRSTQHRTSVSDQAYRPPSAAARHLSRTSSVRPFARRSRTNT
jgi:hypothetical protein